MVNSLTLKIFIIEIVKFSYFAIEVAGELQKPLEISEILHYVDSSTKDNQNQKFPSTTERKLIPDVIPSKSEKNNQMYQSKEGDLHILVFKTNVIRNGYSEPGEYFCRFYKANVTVVCKWEVKRLAPIKRYSRVKLGSKILQGNRNFGDLGIISDHLLPEVQGENPSEVGSEILNTIKRMKEEAQLLSQYASTQIDKEKKPMMEEPQSIAEEVKKKQESEMAPFGFQEASKAPILIDDELNTFERSPQDF
ncbi:uncharacterized protein LOC136033212 isoform X2 [Artemia franciscana]|uniref:uncharacterized protein LOC136033212 isoform X2 n=1 Tax=Artemia franciscana TaxID=6661 RepID=UPI0032DA23DA